jgi:acetoacetyl-CoA synthetase
VVRTGQLLWAPHPERAARSNLAAFERWLALRRRLKFSSYDELWRWSVTDLEGFWAAVWDYFLIQSSTPYSRVLARRQMPGAEWFPGAHLNYAEHALRHERDGVEAFLFKSESTPLTAMSWIELGNRVRVLATRLRELGVKPGDRVVAYLPNGPEAVIALLAAASVGAVWSSCGPDFGARGVLDRFAQLDPKVLVCATSYRYGGQHFDRRPTLHQIVAGLPTLKHVICAGPEPGDEHALRWDDLFDHPLIAPADFQFEQVAFDHPLWVLFTSGTTGAPKPIVHGHGGIVLEHLKHLHFNFDIHARDRMFFHTTTGWMMWNFLVGGLLSDVVPVLYDGSPSYPNVDVLWQLAEESRTSLFAASPSYVSMISRAGLVPKDKFDLSHLDGITLAGSPASPECMKWFYDNVKADLWVAPGCGGTDVCTGFLGGVPTLPIYAGEIQARALGCAVHAFNEKGESVVNEVGELVITEPMPSMPLHFWRDPGHKRYRESYFDLYPGVWRHGDFLRVNRRGGCFVLGRSDATLTRRGVRIGTAEIYRSLAMVDEVEDSLVVNLSLPGERYFMPLFVKLREGVSLDERLAERIREALRNEYSPRHVPDRIYQVDEIPLTHTGKKLEVPVRRILMGSPVARAVDRASMAQPRALDFFIRYARRQSDYSLSS